MSKQVQIDIELFENIVDYFFNDADYLKDDIQNALRDKVDKMLARELFSKYKRTPSSAEREQARQEYLNHQCVSKQFRTDKEVPNELL